MKTGRTVWLALALWLASVMPGFAQSPRELLQNAIFPLPSSPLRYSGTLQTIYPLPNMGRIVWTEGATGSHIQTTIGGVVVNFAFNASTGKGWRQLHGAVFPLEDDDARQFHRLSLRDVRSALIRGARGDLGVMDCGKTTLPDGREARWLKVIPHTGTPWDIYLDEQGKLLAWGTFESDSFRRQPTRFVVLPSEWKDFGALTAPAELRVYEDNHHAQTVRWETIEPVTEATVLASLKEPPTIPPPSGLPVTLPLRFFQRVMFADVRLNGHEYTMLLDTGAGITVVDRPVAQALRLPAGETMNVLGASAQDTAEVTRLGSLEIGKVQLENLQVAVTDLGLIRLLGGARFGGILGFNALNRFRVTIDYHRQQVTFSAPGGKPPAGIEARARFPGATPQLEVEVDDIGKLPMLLDTGASMTIIPAKASQQWQPFRLASMGMALGVGGAGSIPRAARASSVSIVGGPLRDVTLMFVSPTPRGETAQILSEAGFGLLGNNLLRHFRVTIDYPMRLVTLERMPKPASMGDSATAGIVLDLTSNTAKVSGVMPLSSASEQGIERGDLVLSVGGRSTKGTPPSEVQKWLAGEEGTRLKVKLQRGDRVWEAELELRPMF